MKILEKNVEYKRWANELREEEQNDMRIEKNARRPTGKESDDEQAGRWSE